MTQKLRLPFRQTRVAVVRRLDLQAIRDHGLRLQTPILLARVDSADSASKMRGAQVRCCSKRIKMPAETMLRQQSRGRHSLLRNGR